MTAWLPWIGIAISLMTLAFTFIKFGREVHLDDKREMMAELARCRERVKELSDQYEKMVKAHNEAMEENRQLKEHNYALMSRITKLRNNGNGEGGKS
jgi:hypothetical protein